MIETANGPFAALKEALRTYQALHGTIAVLGWDQLTKMPPKGEVARAEQLATLQRLAHEQLTGSALGAALARAEDAAAGMDADSVEAALARIVRRDRDRAEKLPAALVMEQARTAALADGAWIEARRANDFASFAPWLRKNVDISRRVAECLGYRQHPFDALIDLSEPGMTTASVRAVFDELRPHLVDLTARISRCADVVDNSVLFRDYDEIAQERLALTAAAMLGYDFERGRLDRTVHPFEMAIAREDVRITTRYDANFLSMSLMGTMHETGHALYEQGIGDAIAGTPLAHGASDGMHESQSRLWENHVGRSRPFWRYFFPHLQAAFPGVIDDADQEGFYRAMNKVQPSLIRVEADEVTYCLHIILRFDLEIALLEGTLQAEDAPAAWNDAMRDYLGIIPPDDTRGVLQDIHWTAGLGGFQGYALGNVIAAQLWETIAAACPDLHKQIAHGDFGALLSWLRLNIHQYGRRFDPADLLIRATGKPLTIEPYIRYLEDKFGAIYGLQRSDS